MIKLNTIILLIGLCSTQVLADMFDGECDDTIYNPKKHVHIKYHNNSWSWGSCSKSSKKKTWYILHIITKRCADPRVDGCSLGDSADAFTKRAKRLMTPSCNAHDLCYSTKGMTKGYCDDMFKKNLKKTNNKFNGRFFGDIVTDAVVLFGQSSYDEGQQWGVDNNCYK